MRNIILFLTLALASGCASKPADLIIGTWKAQKTEATVEYNKDGSVYVIDKDGIRKVGKYKFIDDTTLEHEIDDPALMNWGKIPADVQKEDTARLMAKTLEQSIEVYKICYGEYPPDLRTLTKPGADGNSPTLNADQIIDPWGRLFVYEPENLDPLTRKPRIYYQPPPKQREPKSIIVRMKVNVTKQELTLTEPDRETKFVRVK